MLSINECEKILNKKNNKYSTEETKAIREILYELIVIVDLIKKNDDTVKG